MSLAFRLMLRRVEGLDAPKFVGELLLDGLSRVGAESEACTVVIIPSIDKLDCWTNQCRKGACPSGFQAEVLVSCETLRAQK